LTIVYQVRIVELEIMDSRDHTEMIPGCGRAFCVMDYLAYLHISGMAEDGATIPELSTLDAWAEDPGMSHVAALLCGAVDWCRNKTGREACPAPERAFPKANTFTFCSERP
jgi:hypothetical protein